ncbi:MFS transporter [Saccharothrix longispora]|uniref:MFS transporter n=1 Tax=Saccharothrix longispora TaxID=33920 RepID=UPI0028FDB593|nr:MFS transporter [Saccharothrix longispora]MDU0292798.1 MFS transporter [Saccharothrix longispora]
MTTEEAPPRAGWREWLGLAVLALPTTLAMLDISVLFIALPHLGEDLGADGTQQLWITDIYGFMIAGFLVTMGTLGDRIGRRRLLLIGAVAFTVASVLAAYSTSTEMLIISRALLGIAGAPIMPCSLALLMGMFKDAKQLGIAFAVWSTAMMVGVTLGPVVGGAMLESFWWGSVFLLGVPVMLLVLVLGPMVLPESRKPNPGRLDLSSVALSLATILPFTYGLKELVKSGWHVTSVLWVLLGVVSGVVFVVRQRKLADPLLDLRLFGIREVSGGLLVSLIFAAIQGGTSFFAILRLQVVEGLSALDAGLWLLPPSLALVAGINLTPLFTRRVRPAYVLAATAVVGAVGQLLLFRTADTADLATLLTGLSLVYFSVGPVGPLVNQLVMGNTPPEQAGSAGSMSATCGEFGIAFGIAAMGSIGAVVYRNTVSIPAQVPAEAAGPAADSAVGAVGAAQQLRPDVADELLAAARDAFNTGMHAVSAVSGILLIGIAVLVVVGLRGIAPYGTTPTEAEKATSSNAD